MAARTNTIVLTNPSIGYHDEGNLASGVTTAKPGMFIAMDSAGNFILATNATNGLKILKEDALQGKQIGDVYAASSRVGFYQPLPGDRIHVLVKSGQTVAVGAVGTVVNGFAEVNATKTFEFLEASGGALAADTHLKARVL